MSQKQSNLLVPMISEKKATLWEMKAPYMTEKQEVYFNKALLSVSQNQDLLKLTQTKPGALSLFNCISNALQMGLQVGAQIPQCYIVPMGPKAQLIPTAEGLKSIALSEPPVLKSFIVRAVYEGEKFNLNYATGEVIHEIDIKTQRGELAGVYCMITDLKDIKSAEFMPRSELEKVRDTHSTYFIRTKKGPWRDDFDMMCLKTASKRFLKPWAALKEGLQMAIFDEDEIAQSGDIQDRAGEILDSAIETDASVEMSAEEKPKETTANFQFDDSQPEDKF